ncbi:hypothetical protein BU16DRAFT_456678, partial [Lophium mytilinum]
MYVQVKLTYPDSHRFRTGEKLLLTQEQKMMLLDSLRFDQIDARRTTIKNAHTETCEWLLRNPKYADWLDATERGEHLGFLWIKGHPGSGKSTLMKFALTNARKKMKGRIVISFFFNARGEALEKSTVGAYRSLLLQLLERLPNLDCVFDSLDLSTSNISTHHPWSVESLETLLKEAIQSLGQSSVVCFIDALDECEEFQIRDMISFFGSLNARAMSADGKFHICFASRHYPHISIRKSLDLVLEGQEGHGQDITNYLNSELKIGDSEPAEQIRTELQEKASGIFMWVVLVVRILNKEHDAGNMHVLQRRLRETPSDLHDLFRDILTRDSDNQGELVLCVQWVLFSKRPLSPVELYYAILFGVEPDTLSTWVPNKITRNVMERFILNTSKGFVEVTTSEIQKVQFIHESVRDFLLEEDGLGKIWPELSRNFHGQSHERLKNCCLNYINIDVFPLLKLPDSLPKASSQEAKDHRQAATRAFPLLDYAVRNVLYHADLAVECGINQENLFQNFPLERWIQYDNLLEKAQVRRHTKHASLLYLLAEHNMSNLIRVHPSIQSFLQVENERYGLPLYASLATKSKEAIQSFVQNYASTQCLDSEFCKMCSQYCYDDSRQYVNGADKIHLEFSRKFEFPKHKSILSFLAELGDEVLFTIALETGKFVADSKDFDDKITPLCQAAGEGHAAIVKLLLKTGQVNVNSEDVDGCTPFFYAVTAGNAAMVKQLLDTGQVDFDSKHKDGRTRLSHA